MVLINLVSAQGHACQLNKHDKENVFYLLVAFLGIWEGMLHCLFQSKIGHLSWSILFFPTTPILLTNHVPENWIKHWISY